MADKEIPPKKEEKEDEEVMKAADVHALVGKLIEVVKSSNTRLDALTKDVAALSKNVPPGKDAEYPSGKGLDGSDHDASEEQVKNHVSEESAVGSKGNEVQANNKGDAKVPGKQKAALAPAIARGLSKADVEDIIVKSLTPKIEEMIAARTPDPIYQNRPTSDLRKYHQTPGKFIDELCAKDRAISGGAWSNPADFSFGVKRHTEDSAGVFYDQVFKMFGQRAGGN